MKLLPHTLLALAVAGTLAACRKDEPAEIDLGHDYFPTNIGHWIEYQVDSFRIRLAQTPNTFDTTFYSYALREVLTEDFTDDEGRPAQRIIRYTRDMNNTWLPKDVWWQTRDNVRAERSEENMRRIKLLFPPRRGAEWNTNATNVDDAFGLEYDRVDEPFTVNGLSFEKTVEVVGNFPNNPIESRSYLERYAKGVGMITHTVDSINAQPIFPLGSGWTAYDRWYVNYTITAYGN